MRLIYLLSFFLVSWTPKQSAIHSDSVNYCLPFSKHNTFVLSQGENSKTHTGDHQFAYDFAMPIGSPVHAARSGIIRQIIDGFKDKAQTEEFKTQGNYILIEHDDGTLAVYAHLDHKGAAIKVGDKIQVGKLIGYSGNTGYTSGPHLHFEVFIFEGSKTKSVPVKFHTGEIVPIKLEASKSYKAPGSCSND